jgi:hypothetical protein
MACDLCGKKGVALIDLREQYKTEDVAAICPDCERIINKQLRKVQDFAFNLIPKLMRQYLKAYRPDPIAQAVQPIAEMVKVRFDDGFMVEWSEPIADGTYVLQAVQL